MAANDRSAERGREVLTALPSTRPTRRSAKRAGGAPQAAAADVAAATPKAAAGAPKGPSGAPRQPSGGKAAPSRKAAASPRATAPRKASTPSGARKVPPAGYATPNDTPAALRGGDLVATALQAVGELAQLGAAAGIQGLKSALGRLPRP
jgi:hypothetical protein